MSEKAKAMMERLKTNSVSMENGKSADGNVRILQIFGENIPFKKTKKNDF